MTPQNLRNAKLRVVTKPVFLFWVWGAIKNRKTAYVFGAGAYPGGGAREHVLPPSDVRFFILYFFAKN